MRVVMVIISRKANHLHYVTMNEFQTTVIVIHKALFLSLDSLMFDLVSGIHCTIKQL